jgi:parallel beta-helix repeat protein
VLDSCDISSNSGVGAGVEGATLQLRDCAVHDCERHGVAAYGGFEGAPGRALLMGCRISGNKLSGVLVRDGGSAVLRENTVERNGEYGVALLDGCTARLFDNRVALNGAGSVQIDVGSVAVDVAEVAARNALDQPAAEVI